MHGVALGTESITAARGGQAPHGLDAQQDMSWERSAPSSHWCGSPSVLHAPWTSRIRSTGTASSSSGCVRPSFCKKSCAMCVSISRGKVREVAGAQALAPAGRSGWLAAQPKADAHPGGILSTPGPGIRAVSRRVEPTCRARRVGRRLCWADERSLPWRRTALSARSCGTRSSLAG